MPLAGRIKWIGANDRSSGQFSNRRENSGRSDLGEAIILRWYWRINAITQNPVRRVTVATRNFSMRNSIGLSITVGGKRKMWRKTPNKQKATRETTHRTVAILKVDGRSHPPVGCQCVDAGFCALEAMGVDAMTLDEVSTP